MPITAGGGARWVDQRNSYVNVVVECIGIVPLEVNLTNIFLIGASIQNMYSHTPGSVPRAWDSNQVDSTPEFTELYFSYSSNLSPQTMRGRHPKSLFCGLAKLDNWKFNINSTGFANIVPSEGDVVYGALYFISAQDEGGLDDMEGVPEHYQKQWLEGMRMSNDGTETGQRVKFLVYIDSTRPDEGTIGPEYIVWIRKAIRDAKPFGLPDDYVEKCIRPWLPGNEQDEVEKDMEPVRMMFSKDAFK